MELGAWITAESVPMVSILPISSQNEDSRCCTVCRHTRLILNPAEAKDTAAFAFEFSEIFNIPVMLRPTTRVSRQTYVEIGPGRTAAVYQRFLPSHARPLHNELLAKQGCDWEKGH